MASKHFQEILYENCHSFMQISLKCVPITMFEIFFGPSDNMFCDFEKNHQTF